LTKEDHPIRIGLGDVILPVVRRDDSNGNPTLLQTIPYTFIAVTEKIDDISRLYGAIFTASRGALAAAKNRRTQRIGLKVKPSHVSSDLKLGIQRSPGSAVPGAEIYLRTPGTEALKMEGRTDWRGVLPLLTKDLPTILYDPPSDSKTIAIANARKFAASPVDPPAYKRIEKADLVKPQSSASNPTATEEKKKSEEGENAAPDAVPAEPKPDVTPPKLRGSIQLNVPLYLYYIKNGDTLLARLPIVTGLKSVDQADLPDDRRRLETEAFLKGLQGEVLDLVVRRRILESRIKQKIKANQLDVAERLLDELKRVKSYDKMSEQIEGIQRRALSTDQGVVPSGVVKRIDKMVDTTRQMMQKYLQDTLVRDLEIQLNQAK
jgi:hypothetical protein